MDPHSSVAVDKLSTWQAGPHKIAQFPTIYLRSDDSRALRLPVSRGRVSSSYVPPFSCCWPGRAAGATSATAPQRLSIAMVTNTPGGCTIAAQPCLLRSDAREVVWKDDNDETQPTAATRPNEHRQTSFGMISCKTQLPMPLADYSRGLGVHQVICHNRCIHGS